MHATHVAGAGGQLQGGCLGVPVGHQQRQQSLGGGAQVAARPRVDGEQLASRGRSCVPAVPGGVVDSCTNIGYLPVAALTSDFAASGFVIAHQL